MTKNPALAAFVAAIETELIFGQVRIRRLERGFELGHTADQECDPGELRLIGENDIRLLAQFTASGAFRPLKSAPSLKHGWRISARDEEALGAALNQLYPGAVADWFAAQSSAPPVTSFRDFTSRQTGMYRITALLDDAVAGAVIRACCHKDFCLKRRLWTVDGLAPDAPAAKSLIPCLEPCAILLEFARKMARVGQEEQKEPPPGPGEVARRMAEAEAALQHPDAAILEGDFSSPRNPRRARFVLESNSPAGTPLTGKD